jgi:hypothetical protein
MNTVKRLVAGSALTGALATYYTVAAATSAIVKEIILCNTDVVARTVDVHFIPPAGTDRQMRISKLERQRCSTYQVSFLRVILFKPLHLRRQWFQ